MVGLKWLYWLEWLLNSITHYSLTHSLKERHRQDELKPVAAGITENVRV